MALVMRWVSQLSGWKFSATLIIFFMLFGSLDIINATYAALQSDMTLREVISLGDRFEFLTGYDSLGFFIGNYLSNTFQFYWAPQQVIAGWLGACTLYFLYQEKKFTHIVFIYTLLALWSPFVMIGMAPLIALVIFQTIITRNQSILTLENIVGSSALLLLFMSFYLGGSAGENPSFWIFTLFDRPEKWLAFLIFLLAGWGCYALAITPYIATRPSSEKKWFFFLIISLAMLPLKTFGTYNDLFCRGNAPLLLLLMILILKSIHHYWINAKKILVLMLIILLVPGFLSAITQHTRALLLYGQTQPITTVVNFKYGWENLGADNTFFGKYFRRNASSP